MYKEEGNTYMCDKVRYLLPSNTMQMQMQIIDLVWQETQPPSVKHYAA